MSSGQRFHKNTSFTNKHYREHKISPSYSLNKHRQDLLKKANVLNDESSHDLRYRYEEPKKEDKRFAKHPRRIRDDDLLSIPDEDETKVAKNSKTPVLKASQSQEQSKQTERMNIFEYNFPQFLKDILQYKNVGPSEDAPKKKTKKKVTIDSSRDRKEFSPPDHKTKSKKSNLSDIKISKLSVLEDGPFENQPRTKYIEIQTLEIHDETQFDAKEYLRKQTLKKATTSKSGKKKKSKVVETQSSRVQGTLKELAWKDSSSLTYENNDHSFCLNAEDEIIKPKKNKTGSGFTKKVPDIVVNEHDVKSSFETISTSVELEPQCRISSKKYSKPMNYELKVVQTLDKPPNTTEKPNNPQYVDETPNDSQYLDEIPNDSQYVDETPNNPQYVDETPNDSQYVDEIFSNPQYVDEIFSNPQYEDETLDDTQYVDETLDDSEYIDETFDDPGYMNESFDDLHYPQYETEIFDEAQYETEEAEVFDEAQYETEEAEVFDEAQYETEEAEVFDEAQFETEEAEVFDEAQYETEEAEVFDEAQYETEAFDYPHYDDGDTFDDLQFIANTVDDSQYEPDAFDDLQQYEIDPNDDPQYMDEEALEEQRYVDPLADKISSLLTKIISSFLEVQNALNNEIEPVDGIEDYHRRFKRVMEFSTRFARVYGYELGLQLHDLRRISRRRPFSETSSRKLIKACQTVLQGVQAYCGFIPSMIDIPKKDYGKHGSIHEKVREFLDNAIQLFEIIDGLHIAGIDADIFVDSMHYCSLVSLQIHDDYIAKKNVVKPAKKSTDIIEKEKVMRKKNNEEQSSKRSVIAVTRKTKTVSIVRRKN